MNMTFLALSALIEAGWVTDNIPLVVGAAICALIFGVIVWTAFSSWRRRKDK